MKRSLTVIALLVAAAAAGGLWYVQSKLPERQGQVTLTALQGPVTVRYDERGVPHIRASNQTDLYRALGYVHAQDRLFQMEIMRRLARGELAEVLGPKLLGTDTLFRSLRIRERAARYVAEQDPQSPAWLALQAYLDGINHYQNTRARPVEFDLLGLTPRPVTAEDTFSIAGYMAYSFAAAFPQIGRPRLKVAWAGLIDTMPDVVPVIDRAAALPGLVIATGMSGHGFGIGPGIGRVVADLVADRPVGHDLHRFRLSRFSDGTKIAPGPGL